jgi:DNA invertase Pin-like site-specific DNA recombinase
MSTSSRPITHSPAPESQVVTPVRMPSIFGYTRVSCKSQVAGLSLPKQREAVMTYARQCNMPVAEIFEDAGLSGMKIEKQTALGYAKNAAIRGDKLVVTETNRLTHDTLGGLLLLEELKKKGVELVILDLPFPLDSVKGRYYFINELNISEQETSRGSQRASDFYNYARTGKVELTSKIETLSIDVDPQGVSLNEC